MGKIIDWQLASAVLRNDLEAVTSLLKVGASPNARTKHNNFDADSRKLKAEHEQFDSALYLAMLRRPEIAATLLSNDAAPDLPNLMGRTALHEAAYRGRSELVSLLLAHGATVDAPNAVGRTPLMEAAGQGHLACVEALVQAGARVTAQSDNGTTAFIESGACKDPRISEFLLAHGAQLNQINHQGDSAMTLAEHYQHADTMAFLQSAGEAFRQQPNRYNRSSRYNP